MLFRAWSALDELQLCSFSSDAHRDLSYRGRRRTVREVVRPLGGRVNRSSRPECAELVKGTRGGQLVPALNLPPSFSPPSLIYSSTLGCFMTCGSQTRETRIPHPSRDGYCLLGSVGDPPGRFRLLLFSETPEISRFHDEIISSSWWIVTAVMKLED
jgi:hypothetical protein